MNPELLQFHEQVVRCTRPEELFGSLGTFTKVQVKNRLAALKVLYRRFAIIAHVDKYDRPDEKRIAHVAFTKLGELHRQAIDKIEAGTYGTKIAPPKKNLTPPSMRSKKGLYVIKSGLAAGDLSNVYVGEFDDGHKRTTPVIIKIAKQHGFNDLLEVEAKALQRLNKAAAGTISYKQFIPTLIDNFSVTIPPDNAARWVNVVEATEGFRSLEEIRHQYPDGVDPRHFVWIFNRLLTILSFTHSQGIVHGAVLPNHVLVHPVTHAIHLVDWCFSVAKGSTIRAMSTVYVDWYPPEVKEKRVASSATDIFMAAKCMLDLIGSRRGVHPKFKRLLESCLIKNPLRRPTSAWELYQEMGVIAEELYGARKYVKLEMV
jgi:serine/threonine protein kinase